MSSNTKNLGLLKKDPGTDGAETFNIKTMMNDNWDKIDAAVPGAEVKDAPAGTDHMFLYDNAADGKPKKVLLSKLVELWKKTFYTKEDTDSLLSNKVSKPIQIPSNADLNDYTIPGFYYVGADAEVATIKNSPTSHAFTLLVEIGANAEPVQTLKTWIDVDKYRATTFVRSKYPNWHGGWIKIATATPPQEYDLPLAAGLSNDNQYARSVYWRDQFGVVTFFFQVIKSGTSADIGNGERLAILPAGFRPKALANFAAHFEDIGNFAPALGVVHQDGSIVAYNGSGTSGRKVFGFGSFIAETL